MKDKILLLRNQGKSYNEIQKITGASKGTISYHCSKTVKTKIFARQNKRRKDFKIQLKNEAGGKCSVCGYNKCYDALEFHHEDPKTKEGKIANLIANFNFKKAKEEAKKCTLLCANCHREAHSENGIP